MMLDAMRRFERVLRRRRFATEQESKMPMVARGCGDARCEGFTARPFFNAAAPLALGNSRKV
jgi:hypothetical protein